MATTKEILDEVRREREYQHRLMGGIGTCDQDNSRNDWVACISAYVGRAADKVPRNKAEGSLFRSMMLKVAALAVAAIESHDKGWLNSEDGN